MPFCDRLSIFESGFSEVCLIILFPLPKFVVCQSYLNDVFMTICVEGVNLCHILFHCQVLGCLTVFDI